MAIDLVNVAAGAGGHIHQIDRHVLRSVSLAKLWEVAADARGVRLALPRLRRSPRAGLQARQDRS